MPPRIMMEYGLRAQLLAVPGPWYGFMKRYVLLLWIESDTGKGWRNTEVVDLFC